MCWCGMIEWTHSWNKIKVNLTENTWNNLGQLSWTLPLHYNGIAALVLAYRAYGLRLLAAHYFN